MCGDAGATRSALGRLAARREQSEAEWGEAGPSRPFAPLRWGHLRSPAFSRSRAEEATAWVSQAHGCTVGWATVTYLPRPPRSFPESCTENPVRDFALPYPSLGLPASGRVRVRS